MLIAGTFNNFPQKSLCFFIISILSILSFHIMYKKANGVLEIRRPSIEG